jgi:gamma-glutamyltranspeptidase/glutathione hydrolase
MASCEYFNRNHGGEIPLGILESQVPAALDAYVTALEHFGTMSFAEVAAPAIRFARDGFPMYPLMAQLVGEKPLPWPTTREHFMPGGRQPKVGELFVQADLGATIQFLADEEVKPAKQGRKAGLKAVHDAFYKGDIACKIDAYYAANGGLVRFDDLAGYRGGIIAPDKTRFADLDIHAYPPGGSTLLEALNILSGFDLRAMGHNTPDYIHTVVEAFKLAFADREAYVADPEFVDVPMETLLSAAYADRRRACIDPENASPDLPPPGDVGRGPTPPVGGAPGTPDPALRARSDAGTSYCCAVDSQGNAISSMISGGNANAPVVPGTGFGLAHFGLSGYTDPSHANCVAPGKRMRCGGPAIAIREGELVMPFGTPGSDVIPQAMAQALINIFVFGMDPQLAVEAPRFATYSTPALYYPHDYVPGELKIEETLARSVGEDLGKRGHKVEIWPDRIWRAASVCAIIRDTKTGLLAGGADNRRDAYAIGW